MNGDNLIRVSFNCDEETYFVLCRILRHVGASWNDEIAKFWFRSLENIPKELDHFIVRAKAPPELLELLPLLREMKD